MKSYHFKTQATKSTFLSGPSHPGECTQTPRILSEREQSPLRSTALLGRKTVLRLTRGADLGKFLLRYRLWLLQRALVYGRSSKPQWPLQSVSPRARTEAPRSGRSPWVCASHAFRATWLLETSLSAPHGSFPAHNKDHGDVWCQLCNLMFSPRTVPACVLIFT